MVTPAARREAVAHLQGLLKVSERRACSIIGADRKSVRYRSRRGDDADLRERLRELARERRRFGYRRLHILLRRDGVATNRNKTHLLYTEEGLTVNRRANGALTHFPCSGHRHAAIRRALSKSRLARPYIWRLTSFSRVT